MKEPRDQCVIFENTSIFYKSALNIHTKSFFFDQYIQFNFPTLY